MEEINYNCDSVFQMMGKGGCLGACPGPLTKLGSCGAARHWPDGRGVFHDDDMNLFCFVNIEDHCRIVASASHGDVKRVFQDFVHLCDSVGKPKDMHIFIHINTPRVEPHATACPKSDDPWCTRPRRPPLEN